LLIYVDDILLISSSRDPKDLKSIKDEISRLYKIKVLGEATFFLGIKLDFNNEGNIKLSQTRYVKSLLERFNMTEAKSFMSPMLPLTELMEKRKRSQEEETAMIGIPYREAIGALMYLSVRTRPDISVAVCILAKHVQEPRSLHWEAVKRILRYLKGTMEEGLILYGAHAQDNLHLKIHADADWGTDPEDRQSRTGIVCQLGKNTIWWKSRKQTSVAVSSCEAEYMALFEASRDAVWLRNLLCEFELCQGMNPTIIYHDNQGSIHWAREGVIRKVKHVDLRYHFTHKLIEAGTIDVQYIKSEENNADCLTKPLTGQRFTQSKTQLGIWV
jgi:Reverse transcriptase (RNA-dependent DNA polymerase)